MNKKFSTLVAVVLAATSFGATAQIVPTGDFAKYVVANAPSEGMPAIKSGYFQLAVGSIGGNVLAMQRNAAGKYELSVVTGATTVEVRNTLWKAVVSGNAEAGYSYQLQNVGTGELLAVDTDDAIPVTMSGTTPSWPTLADKVTTMGSAVSVWKWVAAPDPVGGFVNAHASNLTSAFGAENDSVVTLALNTGVANGVKVAAVKYALKNIPNGTLSNQIKAVPASPQPFTLGVDDLNSLLWKQNPTADASKAEFTFTPNVINDETNVFGNLFTENAYKAVPAVGFPAAVAEGTNPFNGLSTSYDALYDAEIAYYQKAQEKVLANALLTACLKDGAIDNTQKGNVLAALAVIANGTFTTDVETVVSEIENLTYAENDQAKAVVKAAVAYVSGVHGKTVAECLTAAQAIKTMSTVGQAGSVAKLISDAIDKAAAEAAIKTAYTDKLAADAALATAITSAKATLTTAGYYATGVANNGWVSLMLEEAEKAEDNTYLSVARSFVTETQNERERPLAFTTGKFADFGYTADPKARLDLNGRYNFQFTYFPNADSLVIRTGGWAKKNNAQTSWGDMNTTDNPELGVAVASPNATAPTAKGSENNIVKLIYLANNHSEITVGSSDYYIGAAPNTVNTRISIKKIDDEYVKTTLESGVYFFNLFSEKEANKAVAGKNLVAAFAGQKLLWADEETSKVFGDVQNFEHMPRAQWVVKQNSGASGIQTVNIYNREYPDFKVENVQLYKGGSNDKVFAVSYGTTMGTGVIAANDTLSFVKATGATVTTEELGYKALDYDEYIENVFALKYFNGLNAGNFVEVDKDAAMAVNPELKEGQKFVFVPAALKDNAPVKDKYGYQGTIEGVKNLTRIAYKVQVYDPKADAADKLYLLANGDKGYTLTDAANATTFYFKENNELQEEDKDAVCYYALVQKDLSTVSGVKHPSLVLSVEGIDTENSIATFAFDDNDNALYRRLGKTITDEFENMTTDTAKFFMANEPTRFLYENSANRTADNGTAVAKDSLNFLGVINVADRPENSMLPIFIDTAYVRNNTTMPQYMLAVGAEYTPAGKYNTCPDKIENCHQHPTIDTKAFITGRYLVSLEEDSAVVGNDPIKYQDKYRLAFVEAKHIEDTLVIANSKYTGVEKHAGKDSIMLNNNKKLNVATFAFRIVDGSSNADFYLQTATSKGETRYVRVHNGVPVLVDNIAEAAQFNLKKTSEKPVANETIDATSVSVIAGNGDITIKGAEGKKVTISNVLGQTIANTVITSSEATISAPKGYVTVAVEGEKAVKAIVK